MATSTGCYGTRHDLPSGLKALVLMPVQPSQQPNWPSLLPQQLHQQDGVCDYSLSSSYPANLAAASCCTPNAQQLRAPGHLAGARTLPTHQHPGRTLPSGHASSAARTEMRPICCPRPCAISTTSDSCAARTRPRLQQVTVACAQLPVRARQRQRPCPAPPAAATPGGCQCRMGLSGAARSADRSSCASSSSSSSPTTATLSPRTTYSPSGSSSTPPCALNTRSRASARIRLLVWS
mmetsp:Transcript_34536/g.87313  ORF Transcript_34536/g.87313 Transcript_34536/m.87313 type:complete len:236 (+) Transcript_34536:243-950(+)